MKTPAKHPNAKSGKRPPKRSARPSDGKPDSQAARPHFKSNAQRPDRDDTSKGSSRRGKGGSGPSRKPQSEDRLFVYGVHTVKAALQNPKRKIIRLYATPNGLERLADALPANSAALEIREVESSDLHRLVGAEPVHQGVVLECAPLDALDPSELFALGEHDLLLVLDQVTDPHNVGAILRSAVALGAGAVITTARHAASESAVLAKSASGAVDMIDQMPVRNLSKTVEELANLGFITVGLDSDGPADLVNTLSDETLREDRRYKGKPLKLAIVLGAEGKGLRQQTSEACTALARLDMPGPIRSLNVSNAAVLALYLARSAINQAK